MRDVVAGRIKSDLAKPNCLQIGDVKLSIHAGDEVKAPKADVLAGDEGDDVDVCRIKRP